MTSVKQQKFDLLKEILDTPYGKSIIGGDRQDLAKSLMSMDLEFLKKALVKFKKRKSFIVDGKSYTLPQKKTKTNTSSGVVLKSNPPPKRPNSLVKESKTIIKKPETKVKKPETKVKKPETKVKKPETKDKEPRNIAQAKTMGKDYFIDKNNNKKAAVTAEELKKSGLSLRDYLNKKRGLKRKTKK